MDKATFDNHYSRNVTNFETVILNDGAYVDGVFDENYTATLSDIDDIADLSFGSEASTTYTHTITLNAGLTDTDGSETLSDITLNNIPSDATIKDSSGNEISANTDGSYTIPTDVNGDATVTLSSPNPVEDVVLNNITSSVTSTENNGGDTSEITVNSGNDGITTVSFDDEDSIDLSTVQVGGEDVNLIDMDNDSVNHVDLDSIIDITDDDNDLVFVGDDGDIIDFGTSEEWTKSEGTKEVEGVDGDFTEYVNTSNPDVSVFVNDDIDVIQTDF